VTFDPKKIYEGFPKEKFQKPLGAGEYELGLVVTLDQVCKDQRFYYDFVLEEADKN
jgi:hypothetical protein